MVHMPSDSDTHDECVQAFLNLQKLPEDIELNTSGNPNTHVELIQSNPAQEIPHGRAQVCDSSVNGVAS